MNIVSNKPTITRKEMEGVLDCLVNGELVGGQSVKNFENALSTMLKMRFSLATNSSTSAYHLIFKALEIGNSDEIIISSFFDIAPLSAATLTGASAVLTDVEENSFTPSPEQIKEKITGRTKAIIIGHNFGFPVDINSLAGFDIPVIEDLSHIIGADFQNDPAGNVIRVASFSPGSLITTGNGGIVLTNNSRLYSVMKDYRENSSNSLNIGYDYCLTDFQAAMGIHQLNRLRDFIKRRKDIAKLYYDSIKFSSHKIFYHFNEEFLFQSFPVIFDSPVDKVENYWKKLKIEISKPITTPLHKYLNLKSMDYPNSERLSNKLFSLPIYPSLTKKEIDRIAKAVAKFV